MHIRFHPPGPHPSPATADRYTALPATGAYALTATGAYTLPGTE